MLIRGTAFTFMLLFAWYGYEATRIPLDFWSLEEVFNARTFPVAISLAGMVVSLLLLVFPGSSVQLPPIDHLNWKPVVLLVFLLLAYGNLLESVGFLLATILFVAIASVVLGARKSLPIALISTGITCGFALLMAMLDIKLPGGILDNLVALL